MILSANSVSPTALIYRSVHIARDSFDVRCDRQTPWGNPFPMNNKTEEERTRVIRQYRYWLWGEIQNKDGATRLLRPLIKAKNENGGTLRLGCWCAPKPCHCDVLGRACEWLERNDNKLRENSQHEQ
jgi:hypothetical protein